MPTESTVRSEPSRSTAESEHPGVAEDFKAAFREHPAGVALITAKTPEGRAGLTASSVASVGLDPVSLVFSVTRRTGSAGAILGANTYTVHLLDARHAGIAREFAAPGGERFTTSQGWEEFPTGEPLLPGTRAALRCRTLQTVEVGASTLVVAEVLEVRLADAAEPMAYLDRAFRQLGESL